MPVLLSSALPITEAWAELTILSNNPVTHTKKYVKVMIQHKPSKHLCLKNGLDLNPIYFMAILPYFNNNQLLVQLDQ